MDDFHGVGPADEVPQMLELLRGVFDLKATEAIVTGRYAHLKRDRLRKSGETMVRANTVHTDNLVTALGMEKANTSPTPSLDGTEIGAEIPLGEEQKATYRKCVGIALYVAPDRWDIQRDVQLLSRHLQDPSEWDQKRLVRLVRYLKGTQGYGVRLQKPMHAKQDSVVLDMFSDTDFAGCKETRRAMTCGMFFADGQPIHGFARRQGVQSTSSGEAELYGSSSVVFDGRLLKGLLEWLGWATTWSITCTPIAVAPRPSYYEMVWVLSSTWTSDACGCSRSERCTA